MGSPGAFIHSGTFGGRLSPSVAAEASLPAKPATTAPPINAPPSRRKRRRDVTRSLSGSAGSVIAHLRCKTTFMEHRNEVVGNLETFQGNAISVTAHGRHPRSTRKPDRPP